LHSHGKGALLIEKQGKAQGERIPLYSVNSCADLTALIEQTVEIQADRENESVGTGASGLCAKGETGKLKGRKNKRITGRPGKLGMGNGGRGAAGKKDKLE